MSRITQSTTVTVGLTIIIIGCSVWVGKLWAGAIEHDRRINKIEQSQKSDMHEIKRDIRIIRESIVRLETILQKQ